MDNSKVNGLNAPLQGPAAGAQLSRAGEAATNRFARAMHELPPPYAATIEDAPRARGRAAVNGTPLSELTRERAQENLDHAYRRWTGPLPGGVMGAVTRDVGVDPSGEQTRAHYFGVAGAMWSPQLLAAQAGSMSIARSAPTGELTQMLERMCSALYVGEKSAASQRVVMALDHVLPGAAAEIVREGVHLSIRLHARTEESYRSMSLQRDALVRALTSDGGRGVDVTVVFGNDEKSSGHG